MLNILIEGWRDSLSNIDVLIDVCYIKILCETVHKIFVVKLNKMFSNWLHSLIFISKIRNILLGFFSRHIVRRYQLSIYGVIPAGRLRVFVYFAIAFHFHFTATSCTARNKAKAQVDRSIVSNICNYESDCLWVNGKKKIVLFSFCFNSISIKFKSNYQIKL